MPTPADCTHEHHRSRRIAAAGPRHEYRLQSCIHCDAIRLVEYRLADGGWVEGLKTEATPVNTLPWRGGK